MKIQKILTETRKEDNLYFAGPFWIIGNSLDEINKGNFEIIEEKYLVSYDGKPLLPILKSQATHQAIWESKYKNKFGVPYNYFPRGRVVFQNGNLYLNIPEGLSVDAIQDRLLKEFDYKREFDKVFYKDPTTGGHYNFLLK